VQSGSTSKINTVGCSETFVLTHRMQGITIQRTIIRNIDIWEEGVLRRLFLRGWGVY
jgi:hypothetical protein